MDFAARRRGCQLAARPGNISIDNGERVQRIEVVWHSPLPWIGRPCFICSACKRGCYHLFDVGVFACQLCHRLDWRSRHRNRFAPSLDRAARLRRKLDADPHAFAPLPPRPRHHTQGKQYDKLVAALAIQENQIAAHLGRVVGDLTRRTARPARKGKATGVPE